MNLKKSLSLALAACTILSVTCINSKTTYAIDTK